MLWAGMTFASHIEKLPIIVLLDSRSGRSRSNLAGPGVAAGCELFLHRQLYVAWSSNHTFYFCFTFT